MKIRKILFVSIFFIFLMTILSSYTFWWNAVYKLQVVASGSAYNTGRMYCETPIHVLLDNPTTGAGSYQINVYFSWGTQINPISSWYTSSNFERSPFSNVWVYPSSPNITGGNLLTYGFYTSSARTGTAWVVAVFRVKNLTWITSTQLVFSSTPSSNSVAAFVGGTELLSWTVPLTINFATWPCVRDINGPTITPQTVVNWAYRVNTGQDIIYLINDRQGGNQHYRYVTASYSDVSSSNYVPDYTTWDNQYGVNSWTISISVSGQVFAWWSAGYSAVATGTTRDLRDRWYAVTINKSYLPAFPIEQTITIMGAGNDNIGNIGWWTNAIINAPRAPFVYRTGVANWNAWLSSISSPYADRSPNTSTLVYPRLNTIRFMVLDDWAGVNSGSLSVTIRSGSIAWPIIRSGGYNALALSASWFTYASNGLVWSNAITHNFNYALNIISWWMYGFNLPYNTDIYVVVSWMDLVNNPFVQTGFANDQNNYFKFTTRNSCVVSQCIDRVIIDTGDVNWRMTFSWTQLTVSWWTSPYLSWDTIYCNTALTGIDLQTGYVTFKTGYLSGILTIKPSSVSGFTTYLSGDTIFVKKYTCGDGIKQTPNFSGNNEQCDDGNNVNGDGCSSSCQLEPVNCTGFALTASPLMSYIWDIITFTWAVRTGYTYGIFFRGELGSLNPINDSGFTTTYGYSSWGLYTWSVEVWNNYNPSNIVTCDFSGVMIRYCWDGMTQTGNGEQCDDGNTSNNDGCSSTCQLEPVVCSWFNLQVSPITGGYIWDDITFSWTAKTGYTYAYLYFGEGGGHSVFGTNFNIQYQYSIWWTYTWYIEISNNYEPLNFVNCYFSGVVIGDCWDGMTQTGNGEQCDDGSGNNWAGNRCDESCQRSIPTCTLTWTPTNGNLPLAVTFTWTKESRASYSGLNLWNGSGYSSFTGVYNYTYNTISIYTPTLIVRNNWDTGIIWICTGAAITIGNAAYTVKARPESRVQWAWWRTTPNLRMTGAKVGIYSWHVLLYTGLVSIDRWGTWILAIPGILQWTYDITFEWPYHARSMLSWISLTQNDRNIDFTTGTNLLGMWFDAGWSSIAPYTWYYQFAWDLTNWGWGTVKDQIITTNDYSLMQNHTVDPSNSIYWRYYYDLNADGDSNSTDLGIIVTNRLANIKTIGSWSQYMYNLPWITY